MMRRRKVRKSIDLESIDPLIWTLKFGRFVMGGLYAYAGILVTSPEFVNVSDGSLFLALFAGVGATAVVYVDHIARRASSGGALYRSERSWKELTH